MGFDTISEAGAWINFVVILTYRTLVYEDRELIPELTVMNFLTVRQEFSRQVRRELDYCNLDIIISVG